jgi:hypothetical protein
MTKVTVRSEAEAAVSPAPAETPASPPKSPSRPSRAPVVTTDAQGRVLTLKPLSALDKMRLSEIVGADNAHNVEFMGYAMVAYHVVAIDGEDVPRPRTRLQLDALVGRLDDDGLQAGLEVIARHFVDPDALPEGQRAALKNGFGTPL